MVFRVEPAHLNLRAGPRMQPQSAHKKLSPSRFRGLVLGTALTVAAIVGANAIILSELYRDTLDDAQGDVFGKV